MTKRIKIPGMKKSAVEDEYYFPTLPTREDQLKAANFVKEAIEKMRPVNGNPSKPIYSALHASFDVFINGFEYVIGLHPISTGIPRIGKKPGNQRRSR